MRRLLDGAPDWTILVILLALCVTAYGLGVLVAG